VQYQVENVGFGHNTFRPVARFDAS